MKEKCFLFSERNSLKYIKTGARKKTQTFFLFFSCFNPSTRPLRNNKQKTKKKRINKLGAETVRMDGKQSISSSWSCFAVGNSSSSSSLKKHSNFI
jgi:hypothetical protein